MRKIKNSITGFLLALIALIVVSVVGLLITPQTPQTASAASDIDLTFTLLDDGTYSVKATNFAISGEVVIPESYNGRKVSKLEKFAFSYCENIKKITIPEGVTVIGTYAFKDCYSLETVIIPNSVNEIDGYAFIQCRLLKNINIPREVSLIEEGTFYSCHSLENLIIPESVTSIGEWAFHDCRALKSIIIPGGVTNIGEYAFIGSSVETIYFHNTSYQWGIVPKGNQAIPSKTKIICTDTPNEITTGVEEYAATKDDVTVNFFGYMPRGYFSRSDNEYPSSATTRFSSGDTFTEEGFYKFEAQNNYSATTVTYFIIDKSVPEINLFDSYVSKSFTMTAQDKYSGVATWEYSLNLGKIQFINAVTVTLGGGAEANGIWSIRAIDKVGNASEWVNVNHVYRESFGNSDSIRNSYFIPSYYVVTLSQKNYNSCYGMYTFADYSSALNFATSKEWQCRVIVLDGGSSWNYVTATNENTRQIYTDLDELNSVIDKYARKNIGDRKVMGKNGAVLNNPTDENGITRADALTEQIVELPALLSAYSDVAFMLAPFSYVFTMPQSFIDGNKSTATLQFISDGISLRESEEKTLEYGVQLQSFITEQGWYLVTESDLCGNVERYLIFIDLQQPECYADVQYGNGSSETIDFNQDYIDGNTGAMRYTEFTFNSLSDNMDNFVMVSVEGRNLSDSFVWGDELPVLNYVNGYYGAYTITIYDRSHNFLSFVVYIAGEAPSLKNTSLTSETACTFTVQINDSYNEIVDVKFFKILFDGTEERIWMDSYETEVCAQNLVYRMNVGGKYVFEFTDLYGRTVRTKPLFYMKGLPSATLRGVKDGGLTKNDVSILYDMNATLELFVLRNGEWVNAELYEVAQGVSGNTLSITAGVDTTAVYKALLYVTNDRNLFTEYTFEIDGILPMVEIKSENGDVLVPGTVTTQSFFATWLESGYSAYYKKQGAVSDAKYTKDTLITAPGTYVFTFYDSARNELSMTMTLDNVVSYTLSGNYILLEDGSYISRSSFTFTMAEPWSVFNVETSNGLTVVNGQKIDTDGVYCFKVQDMYSNALSLTLIIDKLPPVPVITTSDGELLTAGSRTAKSFRVSCNEENVNISVAVNNGGYTAYDGFILDDAATYTFKLTDRVGNDAVIVVTIDREVKYRIDGNYVVRNDVYHSRLWLQVVALEDTSRFEILSEDGLLIDTTKRITDEGVYHVTIFDMAGNVAEITLLIDKTAPEASFKTQSGQVLKNNATTNEPFKVICEEQEVKITYTFNGGATVNYTGELLSESGNYVFTVTDFLGTSAELHVVVDTGVKLTVNGTYVIDDAGKYVSKNWLSITLGEDMQEFYIQSQDGTVFEADSRITKEGEYVVYAKDESQNERELILVIDKTPPTIVLEGVSENGSTNELVTAKAENYSQLYYRYNNGDKIATSSGVQFATEGAYIVIALDVVGNSVSVTFTIDKHIDVTPSFAFVNGQIMTDAISFVFGETVTAVLNHDGVENLYNGGKIAALGNYTLTVTDECQNVNAFSWSIIPPKARNFLINIPNGYTVSAELNGQIVDAVIENNNLVLNTNGNYKLQFISDTENWTLDLVVDNVKPSVQFENTRKSVIISQPNKEGITYTLYYNGAQTAFNLRNSVELTKVGSYRLVCEDEVGNVTEYIFELNYLSDVSIALICVVSALALCGIVTVIIFRFKRRVY